MDDKTFNSIIQGSYMNNFEISSNNGSKNFISGQDDNSIQKSPSLEELQQKYLGTDENNSANSIKIDLDSSDEKSADNLSATEAANSEEEDDVDMRILKNKLDESDDINVNERTVIVSKNEGLLGSQG